MASIRRVSETQEVATRDEMRVAAYVLDRENDKRSDIMAVYQLMDDPDAILATPADDLVFLEPDTTQGQAVKAVQLRHPPKHRYLTNVRLTRRSYYDKKHFPPAIEIVDPAEEWYAGDSADEVATIARELDEPVRVEREQRWDNTRWDAKVRRYIPHHEFLHERGCYLSRRDGRFYVVYNPKIAARRQQRAEKRGTDAGGPPYVTCAEFMDWTRAMERLNDEVLGIPLASDISSYEWRRWPVMNKLRRVLLVFELLFGRNAFWQLEEFRILAKTWQKKGPATWRAFQTYNHDSCGFRAVFKILDEEAARKRKPRKRELKPRLPKGFRWRNEAGLRDQS